MSWELAFAAMSVFLGERLDDVRAAIGRDEGHDGAPAGEGGHGGDGGEGAASAVSWLHALSTASREERGHILARALAPLAAELDRVTLA